MLRLKVGCTIQTHSKHGGHTKAGGVGFK